MAALHQKIFTVPKLRFLVGPATLQDEVSTGTQNWSVRAVISSNKSISVIFTDIQAIFGQLGPFWPFSATFCHFWPQTQDCRRLDLRDNLPLFFTDKISAPFISYVKKGRKCFFTGYTRGVKHPAAHTKEQYSRLKLQQNL